MLDRRFDSGLPLASEEVLSKESSLVLQLQSDCLNPKVTTLEVLRKALVVARKLSVPDFERWIRSELEGYDHTGTVPAYRQIGGELQGFHPMAGWKPIQFPDPETTRKASTVHLFQPISELEDLVSGDTDGKSLKSPLHPKLQQQIQQDTGFDVVSVVKMSPSALRSVIEQVRTAVLNWCLDLEKAGVIGAGMSFSVTEKEAAATITNNAVHFHGEVRNAQIQQGTSHSSQSMSYTEADLADLKSLVETLVSSVGHLNLASEQAQQLVADLKSVEGQLTAPRPSRGVITEAMKSVRNILEGVAGNIIAAEFLVRVGHYIGLS